MTDLIKLCARNFNEALTNIVTTETENSSTIERSAIIYNLKALVVDTTTLIAITDVALLALGIANPFTGLILGLSLFGRVVAEESMSFGEQIASHLIGRVTVGRLILFYDTIAGSP